MNEDSGFFAKWKEAIDRSDAVGLLPQHPNRIFEGNKKRKFIEQDHANGDARLGGSLRTPNLRESYLLAAERLTSEAKIHEELDELAAPIIYCLRHSLELAIKDLIYLAFDVRDIGARLVEVDVTPPTYDELDTLRGHSLRQLANLLKKQLAEIGLANGNVPEKLDDVIEEIHQLENSATIGEAFRYDHSPKFPDSKRSLQDLPYRPGTHVQDSVSLPKNTQHFPESIVIPIVELTAEVRDAIHAEFYDKSEFPLSDVSEANGLEAELTERVLLYSEIHKQETVYPDICASEERAKKEETLRQLVEYLDSADEEMTMSPEDATEVARLLEYFLETTADK